MQNGGQPTAAVPANEGKDTAQPFPGRGGRGESNAKSHKLSEVFDKDDESAIEPDVPHEWASSEVQTLSYNRIKYSSSWCVTLLSDNLLHSLQNQVPAGPWLQYLGQREGRWQGSALLVLPPSKLNMQQQPILTYSAEGMSLLCTTCGKQA